MIDSVEAGGIIDDIESCPETSFTEFIQLIIMRVRTDCLCHVSLIPSSPAKNKAKYLKIVHVSRHTPPTIVLMAH